jgi:hypothetical protein
LTNLFSAFMRNRYVSSCKDSRCAPAGYKMAHQSRAVRTAQVLSDFATSRSSIVCAPLTSEAWRGGRGADLNLLTALKLCKLGPADNHDNEENEYAD